MGEVKTGQVLEVMQRVFLGPEGTDAVSLAERLIKSVVGMDQQILLSIDSFHMLTEIEDQLKTLINESAIAGIICPATLLEQELLYLFNPKTDDLPNTMDNMPIYVKKTIIKIISGILIRVQEENNVISIGALIYEILNDQAVQNLMQVENSWLTAAWAMDVPIFVVDMPSGEILSMVATLMAMGELEDVQLIADEDREAENFQTFYQEALWGEPVDEDLDVQQSAETAEIVDQPVKPAEKEEDFHPLVCLSLDYGDASEFMEVGTSDLTKQLPEPHFLYMDPEHTYIVAMLLSVLLEAFELSTNE